MAVHRADTAHRRCSRHISPVENGYRSSFLAFAGAAPLVLDMFPVLIHEVLQLERTGLEAVWPSRRATSLHMASLISFMFWISSSVPLPSQIFPGWSELASADTAGGALAAGLVDGEVDVELGDVGIQSSSSMTIIPPEPMMEPMATRFS
jgi:hypothetical protein